MLLPTMIVLIKPQFDMNFFYFSEHLPRMIRAFIF